MGFAWLGRQASQATRRFHKGLATTGHRLRRDVRHRCDPVNQTRRAVLETVAFPDAVLDYGSIRRAWRFPWQCARLSRLPGLG